MSAFGWYRPWYTDALHSDLSANAKALAGVLASQEGLRLPGSKKWSTGCVRHTIGYLASLASRNEKTVQAALTELEADGWITKRRSRNYVEVNLVARTGATPVLSNDPEPEPVPFSALSDHLQNGNDNGSHPCSRTGATTDSSTKGSTASTGYPSSVVEGRERVGDPDAEVTLDECRAWVIAHLPELSLPSQQDAAVTVHTFAAAGEHISPDALRDLLALRSAA